MAIDVTSAPAAPGDEPHPLISAQKSATPSGLPVRVHVDARGAALALLATLAFVFALQWAERFFIPVIFAIFIAYTLNPVVCWLERLKLPRVVAASVVMLTLFGALFVVGSTLRDEFTSIVEQLPDTTHRLSGALAKIRNDKPGALQQMQAAANELAKATNQATGSGPGSVTGTKTPPSKPAVIDEPTIKLTQWLWAGSIGALAFLGQATMVLFLVFFLLLSGDKFKRKLVKVTGPSISNKKITVNILDAMNDSIQNYMFMLLVTNILLALLMWGALRWVGLENAGAWAVASGLLHVIPYFGPLLIMGATGLVAFMQFESVSSGLLVAGVSLAIATVVGTFVTTWMTGRIAKMNATAVFIALLFWGWLWGIWGLLLGIPIVVIIKVVAEHVDGMQTLAELLGE
ncbi:MAG: AI-2E family transporter [Herminiimonas sp.]|nr:AI-2E family transporter [Herminiimonas sp.]